MITKVKSTVSWICVLSDLNGEKIVEMFHEKEFQKKTNQKKFKIEKVIKRKVDILYFKWKGYNLFISWIDKKDIAI